jgi:hypothetical protein
LRLGSCKSFSHVIDVVFVHKLFGHLNPFIQVWESRAAKVGAAKVKRSVSA